MPRAPSTSAATADAIRAAPALEHRSHAREHNALHQVDGRILAGIREATTSLAGTEIDPRGLGGAGPSSPLCVHRRSVAAPQVGSRSACRMNRRQPIATRSAGSATSPERAAISPCRRADEPLVDRLDHLVSRAEVVVERAVRDAGLERDLLDRRRPRRPAWRIAGRPPSAVERVRARMPARGLGPFGVAREVIPRSYTRLRQLSSIDRILKLR